ncbi:MAG: SLBB domain-containing protein [Candidatus Marinimicrobia bacterium]|nr:SLBB domain-containing protein [Candidatus Neomarinimicrobiota bacterium]MCF7830150.1 SLBB domain-containing protein [Candidatus Neomarinimicrobiota bacterium]MCF7882227.1 SLBB domain-containing protein [Candidatus Neomarinimicrobiota bacterium]
MRNIVKYSFLFILGIFLSGSLLAQNQSGEQPASRYLLPGEQSQIQMQVNIWGEVQKPGIYKVPSEINLIALLSSAGGPTDYAKLREVRIVRAFSDDAEQEVIHVDLEKYLDNADISGLPELYPGDTIFIPGNFRKYFSTTLGITSAITGIASSLALIVERLSRIQ